MTALLKDQNQTTKTTSSDTKTSVRVRLPQLVEMGEEGAQPEEYAEILREMVDVDRQFRSIRAHYSKSYHAYVNLEKTIAKLKGQWE